VSGYGIAPLFLIRAAGVPFDTLDRLGTPDTSAAARRLLKERARLADALEAAERLLHERTVDQQYAKALRRVLRANPFPSTIELPETYAEGAEVMQAAEACQEEAAALEETLFRELRTARFSLLGAAVTILPQYLVFGAAGVHDLLAEALHEPGVPLAPRNKRARERERHLLLYLQRIAAKNDTFSEFGPSAWGTASADTPGLLLEPEAGIAKREAFYERWAAFALAAAMNADAEVRQELAPRLNPQGRLNGEVFYLSATDRTVALNPGQRELLERCDGETPAREIGRLELLAELADSSVILWEVEVPAMDPYCFTRLLKDVQAWPTAPARDRWLRVLDPLHELASAFTATADVAQRTAISQEAGARLLELGTARARGDRFLYAAVNPLAEECFRECHFTLNDDVLQEVARDAAPWIDLWRDCYAFIASRVAAGLRTLVESAPRQDGVLLLPAFLRHCSTMKMPLTGPAMVALAHIAFQEVKAAFRERMSHRPDAEEWELTVADCSFVRDHFDYERFDAYTYPSADLQLSASSPAAVARGDYQWILGELHPPPAILHHGGYWSCPDHAALSEALASTTCGQPNFHFGFFAADFTAHTAVRILDALPEQTNFVAGQRGYNRWRTVPPSECEVVIDDSSGDVGLQRSGTGEYLGSFARAWLIPLGFHPFLFGRAPHMPRLRCGNVIVQRQSWTVSLDELPAGDFTGVSRDLVLAVEQLRAERNWPRHIYLRPSEQALRRSGAEGRDKDTKPVHVDLESYLSLEIFHRWLVKAGELEVSEMLPDAEHLCWQEADGRRTFELRTLVVPRP
jgi:hypothetical protein